MSDIIERNLIADSIEVRESAEGRRVCGVAAPFDSEFDAGDYVERFAPGAFAKSIQERGDRIPLLEAHRRGPGSRCLPGCSLLGRPSWWL